MRSKWKKDFSFLQPLLERENAFFVIDKTVYDLYRSQLHFDVPGSRLFILDAVEENKTIETALQLCNFMTEIPAKRNSWMISVGGEIVQDV